MVYKKYWDLYHELAREIETLKEEADDLRYLEGRYRGSAGTPGLSGDARNLTELTWLRMLNSQVTQIKGLHAHIEMLKENAVTKEYEKLLDCLPDIGQDAWIAKLNSQNKP